MTFTVYVTASERSERGGLPLGRQGDAHLPFAIRPAVQVSLAAGE